LGGGASDVARPAAPAQDGAPDRDPGGDQRRRAVGVQRRDVGDAERAQKRDAQAAADGETDVARHLVEAHRAAGLVGRDRVDDQPGIAA
jgi:hypothetical protein